MKRMRIQGMTCEGCNQTVAEALTGTGASEVRADFKTGEATYEPAGASEDALSRAVEQAGYRALGIDEAAEPEAGPDHRRGPEPVAQHRRGRRARSRPRSPTWS